MPKSLTYNQDGTFSEREWDSVRHFALAYIRQAGRDIELIEDQREPGRLVFNGAPGRDSSGEPFVLTQEMAWAEADRIVGCKTLGHPYEQAALALLNFVELTCSQRLKWGYEQDGIAESNSNFVWGLGKAREMFKLDPRMVEETAFNRLMSEEDRNTTIEDAGDACHQASWEALRAIVGKNEAAYRATWDEADREKAILRCSQMATESFEEAPLLNVNVLAERLTKIFPQDDMDVRGMVESAHQSKSLPFFSCLVKELRRQQDLIPLLRTKCVEATGSDHDTSARATLLSYVGRSYSAALAEWETALDQVSGAFANPNLHLRFARGAVEAKDEGTRATCAAGFETINNLREAAPAVVGGYLRWREWADIFAYNLMMMGDEKEGPALGNLEAVLRWREVAPFTPADAPDVLGAAREMNDCGDVLKVIQGDGRAALAKAHLELLDSVEALGYQRTLSSELRPYMLAQMEGRETPVLNEEAAESVATGGEVPVACETRSGRGRR